MPDTSLFDTVPILRELRDDLDAAYAEREASRRRPRLRLAAAAAVAAAAIALVAVLPAGDDAGSILEAAAARAAAQPPTAPPAGDYAYFKETGASGVDTTREWWVARDGSGRFRQTMRIPNDFERPANYRGEPRWRRAGDGWVRDARFGRGEFTDVHARVSSTAVNVDVVSLPSEPGALEAALRRELRAAALDSDPETGFRGGENPTSGQILTVIEQSLAHPLATPQQRSALYRVAAGLDGVEASEGAQDPAGRPATVLRLVRRTPGTTVRTEVFFDPDTSATLARRIVTSEAGLTTTDDRVYTPPRTVDSLRRP